MKIGRYATIELLGKGVMGGLPRRAERARVFDTGATEDGRAYFDMELDLKPFNVFVVEHDGLPVPKVIDFGITEAVGERLSERTLQTRRDRSSPPHTGAPTGELLRSRPDTRADIYSLGVTASSILQREPPRPSAVSRHRETHALTSPSVGARSHRNW